MAKASINSFVWGGIMIVFLVGTGIVLTIGTKVIQFRKLGYAFKLLLSDKQYGEALLAIKYRVTNEKGEKSGGPMYYIRYGMSERYGMDFAWLGWLFALFGMFASFGIGNMVQANSVLLVIVGGGLLGTVIRYGVARGVFSNEAGLGSALVILVSGLISYDSEGFMVITNNLEGAALTTTAFETALPGIGGITVSFGLIFFAFSGAFYKVGFVWGLSDTFNGLMAIPNLIGLLTLSPVIFAMTKAYDEGIKDSDKEYDDDAILEG